ILISGYAIKAKCAYIYIRGEFVNGAKTLQKAVDDAEKAGLFKGFPITVHRGAGAYICGEETGLLSSLEGDRGYPKVKPPFPAVEGAWRSPTVVNNASTIASLPHLIRVGADAYSMIGAKPGPDGKPAKNNSPGSQVYCLSGHVKKPGNYEHP